MNVVGWTGIKSLSFPVLTNVASKVFGAELSFTTLLVVSGVGIALGLVSGLSDLQEKQRKLSRESDYPYLLHLGRRWQGCARYDNDYNYYLCREMEEFIND